MLKAVLSMRIGGGWEAEKSSEQRGPRREEDCVVV